MIWYTPDVYSWCFSNQGPNGWEKIRPVVSSSSPPGLDMTQDRSDVRFSELPWQQHPKRRDELQPFIPGIVVVFFCHGEGGWRTSAVQHGNFISYSYEIYKCIIGNSINTKSLYMFSSWLTNESDNHHQTQQQTGPRFNRRNGGIVRTFNSSEGRLVEVNSHDLGPQMVSLVRDFPYWWMGIIQNYYFYQWFKTCTPNKCYWFRYFLVTL